jgi:hypothetical protein
VYDFSESGKRDAKKSDRKKNEERFEDIAKEL